MTSAATSGPAPDPRDRVIWALRRAELAVQNLKDRQLRSIGMAASHYALLVSVSAEPGLAGAALARRLNVTPQAIASLVTRLEDRGWVERRAHARHTQVQELHLTDEGRAALEQADAIVADIEHQVITLLGASESEQLHSLLETLAGSLHSA
ncbi:MarR family transcriptional regulator [Agromyces atrinae]|uniref:MarR family winged helix-turn-helix transcriptional regulator n=1 Tax=Agromyces atrinae TaxID=592376 RepID=UPI001F56172C|nr:MarR family transcriptional regulator [Agromyces atrinae]MCI2957912.1 MarR family transcriptional regulator [Agromyces atrinae]